MWEKPGSTRSFNKIVRHHALPTCHAETLIDDPNRIDAPPAHNTSAPHHRSPGPVSTIRARSRICCPHLPVVQQAGAACTLAVGQPIGTFFVKPMHPVPQCRSLNASPSMPVPQCQSLNVSPLMSGGPFRQSAPPPFGSCHCRQQPMPEVVVSGDCLNIAAQDGASFPQSSSETTKRSSFIQTSILEV